MQPVKPCNTYHAVLSSHELWRGADGKSAFKVYFCDIVGRKEPARTVWAQCGLAKADSSSEALAKVDFLKGLGKIESAEGVGFVTAFPHVMKVFRFGPEAETNCNVRGWSTMDLKPLDLARSDGYVEFACYAEAAIAAEEFAYWAAAKSVEEYLGRFCRSADWPVAQNDKLAAYWAHE
jgi:hypothetical protein